MSSVPDTTSGMNADVTAIDGTNPFDSAEAILFDGSCCRMNPRRSSNMSIMLSSTWTLFGLYEYAALPLER